MLERTTNGVVALIENTKIGDLVGKTVSDLVEAVLGEELVGGARLLADAGKLLWQLPNAIF